MSENLMYCLSVHTSIINPRDIYYVIKYMPFIYSDISTVKIVLSLLNVLFTKYRITLNSILLPQPLPLLFLILSCQGQNLFVVIHIFNNLLS